MLFLRTAVAAGAATGQEAAPPLRFREPGGMVDIPLGWAEGATEIVG